MKKLSEQSLEMLPLILKGRFTDESINTILIAVSNFDKMKEALEFLIELNQNPEGDPNEILRERRISDIKQLLESLK